MRAHTITTKARVRGTGRTKGTIVPGGILALGLAVVLLGATAGTASAEGLSPWYCKPPPTPATKVEQVPPGCLAWFNDYDETSPFDFGDRQVGTTSPVQRFALWVVNNSFNPRVSVSGDYAQTNDCPPTLSASPGADFQGCLITVTFTPTGTGPKDGTLSTGPGGRTLALTGTAVSTPTPPALPLRVSLAHGRVLFGRNDVGLKRKVTFTAVTNNDSTLLVGGGKVKKSTKQLAAEEPTVIKAKLKHPKRLNEKACPYGRTNEQARAAGRPPPGCPGAKIKVKATDEFGQTATDELKFYFYKNPSL